MLHHTFRTSDLYRLNATNNVVLPSPNLSLNTGLVSWWDMEETSGIRVDAVTASGNDLTEFNGVGSIAGKTGTNAADFPNSNDQLGITEADSSDFELGTDISFSTFGWVYFYTLTGNHIQIGRSGGTTGWVLWYEFGTDRFQFVSNQHTGGFSTLNANTFGEAALDTWYWVGIWFDADADEVGIIVNTQSDTATFTGSFTTDSNPFVMGGRNGGASLTLDGRLDAWGFWNRSITSDERALLYNSGNGLQFSDLS